MRALLLLFVSDTFISKNDGLSTDSSVSVMDRKVRVTPPPAVIRKHGDKKSSTQNYRKTEKSKRKV